MLSTNKVLFQESSTSHRYQTSAPKPLQLAIQDLELDDVPKTKLNLFSSWISSCHL
jgi:hypothetical protein